MIRLAPATWFGRGKHPRRKVLLPISLTALLLVAAQVVLAAPPTNVSFTITPNNTPQVGQARTFAASADDADGDITAYEWDFDYNGSFSPDTSGQQVSHSYGTAGSRSVALRVTDGMTNDTTNDQVISVQSINVTPANVAPTAVIDCAPAQINQGDPFSCSSSGSSDPDGGITEYAWRIDSGSFVVGGPTFSPSLAPGNHTITLRVSDGPGASATASDSVSVNGLPQAGIAVEAVNRLLNQFGDPALDQDPGTPTVGQPVAIRSTSTDPGGAITAHRWSFDLDNNAATGPNGGFETAANDVQIGADHFAAVPFPGSFATAGTR
ncbi:MAG: PKD domain-containing protein, partial [Pseudonocardiaceae bacterium]